MKLARYELGGRADIGVVREDGVVGLREVGFGYADMLHRLRLLRRPRLPMRPPIPTRLRAGD